MSGLKDRVDNHHRVGCLEFYLEINSLEPDFRLVSLPSDVLRLRFPSESRKHCNPKFSTFPRKTCGGQWITQRFTAKNRSLSSIPLRKQLQAQRIELDEALRVVLVIGAGIILKRHMRFGVERIG